MCLFSKACVRASLTDTFMFFSSLARVDIYTGSHIYVDICVDIYITTTHMFVLSCAYILVDSTQTITFFFDRG
jgi:hypothetical protein